VAESGRYFLRQVLISGYDEFKRRLARRFGSADVATEVLHETWLRLGSGSEITAIQSPQSYLYRMALNVAADQKRADARWADKAALEALLHCDEDRLDPEHIATMRSEVSALEQILAEMPVRRRAVFMAAMVEDLPYREIAERLGISLRSVEREMADAFDQCAERLKGSWEKGRVGVGRSVLKKGAMPPDETPGSEHD
jgi:RNA polymerase sigma-70 factor, ECF subfamily